MSKKSLEITHKYCNYNYYSFDKLYFISRYPFFAFGLYPNNEKYPENTLILKGKDKLSKVAIFINYNEKIEENEKNLYLIIK